MDPQVLARGGAHFAACPFGRKLDDHVAHGLARALLDVAATLT